MKKIIISLICLTSCNHTMYFHKKPLKQAQKDVELFQQLVFLDEKDGLIAPDQAEFYQTLLELIEIELSKIKTNDK